MPSPIIISLLNSVLNVKAVVAAFSQEKALVGAFSVITNLRMELFEALLPSQDPQWAQAVWSVSPGWHTTWHWHGHSNHPDLSWGSLIQALAST